MNKKRKSKPSKLKEPMLRILQARHHDPFEVLGRHIQGKKVLVRAFLPHAHQVRIVEADQPMERVPGSDFFEWKGNLDSVPTNYRISWMDDSGHGWFFQKKNL